ncbi:MAG: bifunctional DNA-formamidopyrimidine glycosylase/DNA-(apurinic or apyrimidinic site) lyase [Candidatus Sulfotelmatobacter sp.]
MPELPEVETIARGLAKRITGDVVLSVWLGEKPEPLKSPAGEIVAALEHSRIAGVRRMGKHIVFDLERDGAERAVSSAGLARVSSAEGRKRKAARGGGNAETPSMALALAGKSARPTRAFATDAALWIVHLGMSGRLQICLPHEDVAKHTHAIVRLESGRELRFVDPRRFGRLSVVRSGEFDAGGLEPLEVELDDFIKLFRGRRTPIKSALLNQKLLRGVGNIYADESLFRAGIRPRRRASTITREQLHKLFLSVKEVLREAIALGGSSISDYVDADGEEGFFQLQHRVYGREGEPCLVCKTPIKRVVLAGRSSHYCPKCQK